MASYQKMVNEERQQLEAHKLKRLKKGFYQKPRALLWILKEGILLKREYLLMDILLHLENQFAKGKTTKAKRGQWFFCSNADICSYGLLSEDTFMSARTGLKKKGFIDYKSGNGIQAKATSYRIEDIEGFLTED